MLRGIDVPIFATAEVRRAIERDDRVKNEIVGPMMGKEWPKDRRFPSHEVDEGSFSFGDGAVAFRVRHLGPAESPADSVWSLDERTHFVGDLVYHDMHAYLADGRYREWLDVLARLSAEIPEDATLYAGHGAPAPAGPLFAAQRRYVEAFVDSVGRHKRLAPDARRAAVLADMHRVLPTDDLRFLMELSVDPVANLLR
jgi:hypothetical protein